MPGMHIHSWWEKQSCRTANIGGSNLQEWAAATRKPRFFFFTWWFKPSIFFLGVFFKKYGDSKPEIGSKTGQGDEVHPPWKFPQDGPRKLPQVHPMRNWTHGMFIWFIWPIPPFIFSTPQLETQGFFCWEFPHFFWDHVSMGCVILGSWNYSILLFVNV